MKTILVLALSLLSFGCSSNNDWKATVPITRAELKAIHQSYHDDGLVVSEDEYMAIWTTAESDEEMFTRFAELPGGVNSVKEESMWTLLYQAAGGRSPEEVATLLELGARVDIRNEYGSTPLHNAAGMCRVEIAKLLLDAGANVHATNREGNTPLLEACIGAGTDGMRIEMVELLLSYGAEYKIYSPYDEYMGDDYPRTPYDWLRWHWEKYDDAEAKELMDRWEAPPRLPKD